LSVVVGPGLEEDLGRVGAGEALGVARAAASQARGATEVRSIAELNNGGARGGRGSVVRSGGRAVADHRLRGINDSPILIAGVARKLR